MLGVLFLLLVVVIPSVLLFIWFATFISDKTERVNFLGVFSRIAKTISQKNGSNWLDSKRKILWLAVVLLLLEYVPFRLGYIAFPYFFILFVVLYMLLAFRFSSWKESPNTNDKVKQYGFMALLISLYAALFFNNWISSFESSLMRAVALFTDRDQVKMPTWNNQRLGKIIFDIEYKGQTTRVERHFILSNETKAIFPNEKDYKWEIKPKYFLVSLPGSVASIQIFNRNDKILLPDSEISFFDFASISCVVNFNEVVVNKARYTPTFFPKNIKYDVPSREYRDDDFVIHYSVSYEDKDFIFWNPYFFIFNNEFTDDPRMPALCKPNK